MTEQLKITAAEKRAADRRKRQTVALKANLKRRKAQARGRQALDAHDTAEAASTAAAPAPPDHIRT